MLCAFCYVQLLCKYTVSRIASILCKLMEHLVEYYENGWFADFCGAMYSNILEQSFLEMTAGRKISRLMIVES